MTAVQEVYGSEQRGNTNAKTELVFDLRRIRSEPLKVKRFLCVSFLLDSGNMDAWKLGVRNENRGMDGRCLYPNKPPPYPPTQLEAKMTQLLERGKGRRHCGVWPSLIFLNDLKTRDAHIEKGRHYPCSS